MFPANVPLKGVALTKAHVASLALVGPLACVDPLVVRELPRIPEAALADRTLVRLAP